MTYYYSNHLKGERCAAIQDLQTGSSPGNLLHLSCCNGQCILGAPRSVVPIKYDKLERGIDIPFMIEWTSVMILAEAHSNHQ
jgi:hypothetical protein